MAEEKPEKTEVEDDPVKEEGPDTEEDEGKAKSRTTINDANLAAKRLEEATAAQKIENDRTEAMKVQETLSGKAEAGSGKKEESPEDYATRIIANDIETKPAA